MIQPAQRAGLGRRGQKREVVPGFGGGRQLLDGRQVEELRRLRVRAQQGLQAPAQRGVTATDGLQEGGPLLAGLVEGLLEDFLFSHGRHPVAARRETRLSCHARSGFFWPHKTMRNRRGNHATASYFSCPEALSA